GFAGRVDAVEGAIAAVEAGGELGPAIPVGVLGDDELLHLVAPGGALLAAEVAQVVQRAEQFGEPHQVVVVRRFDGARRQRRTSRQRRCNRQYCPTPGTLHAVVVAKDSGRRKAKRSGLGCDCSKSLIAWLAVAGEQL